MTTINQLIIDFAGFLLISLFSLSMAQFFDRDGTTKSASNLTNAHNTPYAYYEFDRDPKRFFANPFGPNQLLLPVNGGLESVVIGLMLAVGVGFIVLPLLMILYNSFGGGNFAFNKPPIFGGRKKREVLDTLFPQFKPQTQQQLMDILNQFTAANDKVDFLKSIFLAT